MKGAIFYSGKYGSTHQYASWISEATGIAVFNLDRTRPDPAQYDFLILGSSIIVMKPTIKKWLRANWRKIQYKPVLLFTVSGTEPGHPHLKQWLEDSLPREVLEHVNYYAFRGRLDLGEVPWWIRFMLKFAAKREEDPEVKQRMTEGFDFMDKASIAPVVEWVKALQNDTIQETKQYEHEYH